MRRDAGGVVPGTRISRCIHAFLACKWATELGYRLRKELWGFREHRIAVRFEYEWHDASGQWYRSYGNEMWEFDARGLMARRHAGINDAPIGEDECRIAVPDRPRATEVGKT